MHYWTINENLRQIKEYGYVDPTTLSSYNYHLKEISSACNIKIIVSSFSCKLDKDMVRKYLLRKGSQ